MQVRSTGPGPGLPGLEKTGFGILRKTGFEKTGFGTGFGKTGGPTLPDLHMGLWPKNRISTRFFFASFLGFRSAVQFWAVEGTQTEQKQRRGIERGDRDWRESSSCRVLGFGSALQFWAAEGMQTEQKQRRGTERGRSNRVLVGNTLLLYSWLYNFLAL